MKKNRVLFRGMLALGLAFTVVFAACNNGPAGGGGGGDKGILTFTDALPNATALEELDFEWGYRICIVPAGTVFSAAAGYSYPDAFQLAVVGTNANNDEGNAEEKTLQLWEASWSPFDEDEPEGMGTIMTSGSYKFEESGTYKIAITDSYSGHPYYVLDDVSFTDGCAEVALADFTEIVNN
ncbi:MAG: hypothetical protein LBM77_03170 [Spirochaetaceae bacterium]|jgi:hypothetical protein|nr:hypothetical protein [Spirochaetaceae bacterium]